MIEQDVKNILRIDSGASLNGSITRQLGNNVIERLQQKYPNASVITRDLTAKISFIDESWIQANMTDPDEYGPQQHEAMAESNQLVAELQTADIILITAPIYNFSVPATLKAWIDMICRARKTFRYTENGPVGLLTDKPVYLVMASGGIKFESPMDFASDYLRHIFSFIGIHDLRFIYAEAAAIDPSASTDAALKMLNQWLPETATAAVA